MPSNESETRTKRSWLSILIVALIGPTLLVAFWAALPYARTTVPVGWTVVVGAVWAVGFVLFGWMRKFEQGDANGA